MVRFLNKLTACCLALLSCAAWTIEAGAELQPYNARYSVYRNGKLTAMTEVLLEQSGDHWIIKSEARGTHGLARLLRARDNEYVEGREVDGRFIPERFERHLRVAGIDDIWSATFDWDAKSVQIIEGKDELTLDLVDGAMDPLSLKLDMRLRLNEENPDMLFWMVDEDEIKEQQFRILETEWLETSLGCLETIPVERVRTNSKRYTRAWHAPGLNNIEVRFEHGKTDGDHMEMRITELTLAQTPVTPKMGCSAMQSH
jgi:hypothetical protein